MSEGFVKRRESSEHTEIMSVPEFGYNPAQNEASVRFVNDTHTISHSLSDIKLTEPTLEFSIVEGADKHTGEEIVIHVLENDDGTYEVLKVVADDKVEYEIVRH